MTTEEIIAEAAAAKLVTAEPVAVEEPVAEAVTVEEPVAEPVSDGETDFTCTPKMVDWLEEEEVDDGCRPCAVPFAVPWYVDELKEAGLPELASEVSALADDPDVTPLQTAQKLDSIKAAVDEGLATRLQELDCTVQVNAIGLETEVE